jgi:hypothetical protein
MFRHVEQDLSCGWVTVAKVQVMTALDFDSTPPPLLCVERRLAASHGGFQHFEGPTVQNSSAASFLLAANAVLNGNTADQSIPCAA